VRRLRQALAFSGSLELIRTVRQAGYALDDEAA
jgi:DNA-binding response OmpR family regulator